MGLVPTRPSLQDPLGLLCAEDMLARPSQPRPSYVTCGPALWTLLSPSPRSQRKSFPQSLFRCKTGDWGPSRDTFLHTLEWTHKLFLDCFASVLSSLAGLLGCCAVACALLPVVGGCWQFGAPTGPSSLLGSCSICVPAAHGLQQPGRVG